MAMKPTEKQVVENLCLMREETRKTGFLHEEQVKYLKLWPMVISDKIIKAESKFNYIKSEVEFKLEIKGRQTKDFSKRFAALTQWTQFLLGDEYKIIIKSDGKQIFKADRLKAASR